MKLKLRDAGLKMALGVSALQYMTATQDNDVNAKCRLIYWRLLDIIFKLDSIDGQDPGDSFLNLSELLTDSRLDQKFQTIRALWQDKTDP